MKKTFLNILLTSAAFAWKLDADGKIEARDGNPIWVENDGSEKTLNADAISRANGDAKQLRLAKEAAEQKLSAFEGIDPEKARTALELAGKIDQKTLIDAGKVDEVKRQITEQFTTQLTEKEKALQQLQSNYDNMQINNIFAASDFIRDRVAVPRDMFEASFKSNFKVEDGKVVAYDKAGNRLMSASRVGEYADPTEAIQLLVEKHPQKDIILKPSDANGSGSGGGGGNRSGGRNVSRADFEKLQPAQQAEMARKAGAGEITIID